MAARVEVRKWGTKRTYRVRSVMSAFSKMPVAFDDRQFVLRKRTKLASAFAFAPF